MSHFNLLVPTDQSRSSTAGNIADYSLLRRSVFEKMQESAEHQLAREQSSDWNHNSECNALYAYQISMAESSFTSARIVWLVQNHHTGNSLRVSLTLYQAPYQQLQLQSSRIMLCHKIQRISFFMGCLYRLRRRKARKLRSKRILRLHFRLLLHLHR